MWRLAPARCSTEEGVTISETKSENGGDKQEFKGTKGDLDITRDACSGRARRPPRSRSPPARIWRSGTRSYAQRILNKIVSKG